MLIKREYIDTRSEPILSGGRGEHVTALHQFMKHVGRLETLFGFVLTPTSTGKQCPPTPRTQIPQMEVHWTKHGLKYDLRYLLFNPKYRHGLVHRLE